jgi:hypothetical protein
MCAYDSRKRGEVKRGCGSLSQFDAFMFSVPVRGSHFPEPIRLFTVINSALLSINFSSFSTRNATSIFMLSAKVSRLWHMRTP